MVTKLNEIKKLSPEERIEKLKKIRKKTRKRLMKQKRLSRILLGKLMLKKK